MKVLKYNVKAIINKGKKKSKPSCGGSYTTVLATEKTKVGGPLEHSNLDHLGQFSETPLQPKKLKN